MTELRMIHVEGKTFVDVNATVAQAKKLLQNSNEITLVARQTEIARIGMIIKTVEQQCGCKVTRLRKENKIEVLEDKEAKKEDKKEGTKEDKKEGTKEGKDSKKEYSVLYFKATLTKK